MSLTLHAVTQFPFYWKHLRHEIRSAIVHGLIALFNNSTSEAVADSSRIYFSSKTSVDSLNQE
jgi:hypothetical protein